DGALARVTKRQYPYGAFFDSTLDRYAEAAVYIGLAAYFLDRPGAQAMVLPTIVALVGSQLVSYVRARAQSLGFSCETGLFAPSVSELRLSAAKRALNVALADGRACLADGVQRDQTAALQDAFVAVFGVVDRLDRVVPDARGRGDADGAAGRQLGLQEHQRRR